MQTYSYIVTVTDGAGKTHRVAGTVEVRDIAGAAPEAVAASFEKLTRGDTTYGRPGEGGCRGPYSIDALELAKHK